MTTEPYADTVQHLLDELERLDLYIQGQVQWVRRQSETDREFQGLFISEEEVDALISRPTGAPRWTNGKAPASSSQLQLAAERLRADIDRRMAESSRRGIPLRLVELARLFGLTGFEVDTLLVCLAPELDLRYERLYAYLQDDVTKKRPSVDLALNLLCPSFEQKLVARKCFAEHSPLRRYELVSLFADPAQQRPTVLGRFLKLDERITEYLLASDELDSRLRAFAELLTPDAELDKLLLPEQTKGRLAHFRELDTPPHDAVIFYFQGPYGVGKQTLAEALCAREGRRLLIVRGQRLASLPDDQFETTLTLIAREAMLQDAALYWNGFDAMLSEEEQVRLAALLSVLEDRKSLSFLAAEETWEPVDALHDIPYMRVELARPEYHERVKLWNQSLALDATAEDVDVEIVAGAFRFSGGQIEDAVRTARNLARWRDPGRLEINITDLNQACRLQSNRKLARLAQKIVPRYTWGDIILPAKKFDQLRQVYNAAKYSQLVYSEWGFGEKLSLGKGLNVLFAGPSGTGKTMAAEIMSRELGLDMYKIDLSTVVSKYIGETEKNLSRIFAEAETANAILFFDEADALFGKRSEVRDAHDRYANIEIGYLLQRMEQYEGVVILASNLSKNMDDAFVRRMHFHMEFPFPNERERLRIWEGVWPEHTPLAPEVDLDFMAKGFELAGGNIKNIALAAAFIAASDGGLVNMAHLVRATQREYEKMGKIIMDGEFGKYGRLVC